MIVTFESLILFLWIFHGLMALYQSKLNLVDIHITLLVYSLFLFPKNSLLRAIKLNAELHHVYRIYAVININKWMGEYREVLNNLHLIFVFLEK